MRATTRSPCMAVPVFSAAMKMSGSPGFSLIKKSISCLVNVELASDQIGCRRQNVAIFSDARDLARALEIAQRLVQTHAHAALPAERFRQFPLVQRPIIGR